MFNMTANPISFLLNNELVSLTDIDTNLTVLEYLREVRYSVGTKEGCASGDCGACTVVVAQLSSTEELHYKSMNACITFIGSLHGKQLITIEHLKESAKLHSVQQSMVDNHGSQCGFCTPGFVMSSFALHKNNPKPSREDVLEDLAGNLCRCTGYRPIIDAAAEPTTDEDSFAKHYQQTLKQLIKLNKAPSVRLENNLSSYFAPKNIDELAEELLKHPDSALLAGGTDLALEVTQQLISFKRLISVGNVSELNYINEEDDKIIIGAAVPISQIKTLLENEFPDFGEMLERFGAKQVRNNATLGGNIGNASPIGDMPPALIVLGAAVTLQRGSTLRTIPIEDYFLDYKKTVLKESEFIREIIIPKSKKNQHLKLYKISKRFDDDISAVLAAFFIELEDNKIKTIRIAFGGMAAIPKRAEKTEKALLNRVLTEESIKAAQLQLIDDFQPLSDVRASAAYRMKVAQNLLMKCHLEIKNNSSNTPSSNIRVVNYA
jgi:xanthine dehydrogenase small subunit